MMNNELLRIFNQLIEAKKEEINIKIKSIVGDLKDLYDKILSIIENPNIIFELDLGILSENIDIEFEVMKRLELYQRFATSTLLKLNDNQKQTIVDNLTNFSNKISEILDTKLNNNQDYINLNFDYNKLLDLFNNLKNNETLTKEEFILCSEIIKKNARNINTSLELIRKLSFLETLVLMTP